MRWAVIPLALCATAAAGEEADGTVHDLTTSDFDSKVKAYPLSFVEFYAPWCGHCKKLLPEWEKTAELAKANGVLVAKVDAIAEKKLAEQHGVQSFPTLKLYLGDPEVTKKYEGPRTADKMAEWLGVWKQGPLLDERIEADSLDAADTKKWSAKAKTIAILGLKSGDAQADAAMTQVLTSVAFALNGQKPNADIPVAISRADESAITELGIPSSGVPADTVPSVVIMRNFDFEDKVVGYRPSGSDGWSEKNAYKKCMEWLQKQRLPALIPASQDTEKFFLSDIDPGNGLVLLFGGDKNAKADIHKLAVKYLATEKRLKWVHSSDNDFGVSLAKSVSMDKEDFPDAVIWEFGETEDDDKVYRLSQQGGSAGITEASMDELIKKWQAGDLSAEKDPVVVGTSSNFETIVINSGKDVMVEFYAPWCGHCKSLAPEYKKTAKHYENDKGVSIVKVDATKHKHKSAEVKGYPTLKFYEAGGDGTPLAVEFKANRDAENIIEYIEANRKSTPQGGKAQIAKKDKKAKKESATAQQPSATKDELPIKTPPVGTTMDDASGVWAFDDAADPDSRGKLLTANMAASRLGYTLVRVGGLGMLIFPDGQTRAARSFVSAEAAAAFVKAAPKSSASAAASPINEPLGEARLPCPANADVKSCEAWCEGVSPNMKTTLGGSACDSSGSKKQPPQCMCYDADFTELYAMCRSTCTDGLTGTCKAGDKTCMADSVTSTTTQMMMPTILSAASKTGSPKTRYFLYDVKYGEGFNLQREVYPRAGWVVAQLNKALEKKCGKDTSSPSCTRWKLVLPPWCRVVHWWTGPEHMPWGTFFDMDALMGSDVPTIEFKDYKKEAGGQTVDLVAWYATEQKEMKAGTKLSGALGEFQGWAENSDDCVAKNRPVPEHSTDTKTGELNFVYAGKCDGGVRTKKFRCGALNGPWPQGVVDMLKSVDDSVGSVLVKGYDYLLSPESEELDKLGLRDSMFWNKELRGAGDDFIKSKFGAKPYIAAHCRRTDFLRVRTKTVPTADTIADQLNDLLKETGYDQVFIATDAPNDLRDDLQKQVKGTVFFYDTSSGGQSFDLPGKQAAVEMWIAARADNFIGSIESRFTMWIQLERHFLGKPKETSERELCKDSEKKCSSPKHRVPKTIGRHRKAYQL